MLGKKISLSLLGIVLTGLAAGAVMAQQSPSYRVAEHIVNAAGHPHDGSFPSSGGYRIRPGYVGEGAVGAVSIGSLYRVASGFGAAYGAPSEVVGLRFVDEQTMEWSAEPSVGTYNLYRGLISGLTAMEFGSCDQYGLDDETATVAGEPPVDDGWYYLVTAVNRVEEEGTKGSGSDGSERAHDATCP